MYTSILLGLKERLSPELWLVFIDADNNFTSKNIESISKKIKELQDSNQKKLYSILVFPYPKFFKSNDILRVFSGDFVIFHPYTTFKPFYRFQNCNAIPLWMSSWWEYFEDIFQLGTPYSLREYIKKLSKIFGEGGLKYSPRWDFYSFL